MWVKLNTKDTNVPSVIGSTFNPTSNLDIMHEAGWRDCTDTTIPSPAEGYELLDWNYIQDPNNVDQAIVGPTWGLIADRQAAEAAAELAWQEAKNPMLTAIENMYIGFLTTEWTNKLRELTLIAADYTITVDNTDIVANMTYLMQMRVLDSVDLKPTYNYFASEFQRFKLNIEALGGIMSKVKLHE